MSEGRKRLADQYKTRRMSAFVPGSGARKSARIQCSRGDKGGGRAEKALRGTADGRNTSELLAGFRQILCIFRRRWRPSRALDQPCRSTSRNERAPSSGFSPNSGQFRGLTFKCRRPAHGGNSANRAGRDLMFPAKRPEVRLAGPAASVSRGQAAHQKRKTRQDERFVPESALRHSAHA